VSEKQGNGETRGGGRGGGGVTEGTRTNETVPLLGNVGGPVVRKHMDEGERDPGSVWGGELGGPIYPTRAGG